MYNNFFGFKERPFQLVPNPAYLFLSKSHEEAFAHLKYALSQGDGFVQITGEVGTGKTTLCRAFLENIDKNTEAAYIFNPKLDSIQLLKTINDEFEISSQSDNVKDLIDKLNAFLITKNSQGKKVIIVIDEAHHLSLEVLEQLRLLSNLETNTSKLLQIILVGQPELSEILDSYELRQLGQRITLSCHLRPMNFKETKDYIEHRLHIASSKPSVHFTYRAFISVYRYSRGIPRLINILCDRSLLIAFGIGKVKINNGIIQLAIKELTTKGYIKNIISEKRKIVLLALLLLSLSSLLLFKRDVFEINFEPTPKMISLTTKVINKPKIEPQKQVEVLPERKIDISLKSIEEFEKYLQQIDEDSSRDLATDIVFELWGDKSVLSVLNTQSSLSFIKRINMPIIFEVWLASNITPRYITLVKMDDEYLTFKSTPFGKEIMIKYDTIGPYWSGKVIIPWKNFLNISGIIPLSASNDSIINLKKFLYEIGFKKVESSNPVYDKETKDAVITIQKKYGIFMDGIVGPLTKIVLYNESKSLTIPKIYKKRKQ
ncbi:MAG: AAA family ATPase [Desulfobacterales bacterium]|nr:AAA family ATPase [Desulfobacterales bacterium]MBF0395905.1 AAA family ATPase [Desulfobacterales bacterium]